MARPKGSKNKSKDEVVEFDYEQMDEAAYAAVMSSSRKNDQQVETFVADAAAGAFVPQVVRNEPSRSLSTEDVRGTARELFLIEGRVRLDQVGSEEPVFSDQRRLVWASDFNEAVGKFSSYFKSLSNYNQRYVVVHVGGTEAIR